MIEIIKHIFGLCGEPHTNIFHLASTMFVDGNFLFISNIKHYFSKNANNTYTTKARFQSSEN